MVATLEHGERDTRAEAAAAPRDATDDAQREAARPAQSAATTAARSRTRSERSEFVIVENKPKHLEFIQRSIDRLENNSILLKGWTIILTATLLGLFVSNSDSVASIPIFVICLPVLGFWFLDGHFQSQERQFRALHEHVRHISEENIDYSMNTSEQKKEPRNGLMQSMFISSLAMFYPPMAAIIILMGTL